MIKPDQKETKKTTFASHVLLFTNSVNKLATQISTVEAHAIRSFNNKMEETQKAITLTINGPSAQKHTSTPTPTQPAEEQALPSSQTSIIYIPEQAVPQHNNDDTDPVVERLAARFIAEYPAYLINFLKWCGRDNQTLDPTRLAQELEKAKSLDQQPPQ